MKILKQIFSIFLSFVIVFTGQISSAFETKQNSLSENPRVNIQLEIKSFESESAALEEAQNLLSLSSTNTRLTTVVSSDNFQFLQQVGQSPSLNNGRNFLVLNDALSRFTKKSVDYVKKSYYDDKIGFAIAVYTTAIETVMWVHVAPMSTLAVSANVAFTIGTALYFRLNKNKWTEVTDKIKSPMRKFFNDVEDNSVRKKIFYDFMANLGLSGGLALMRVPLMSMDQILEEGISLGLLKMPILMSIVGTVSLFTWSEHQGSIDKNEHPISRFVFRRIGEARSILLVTFASTAALLNPGTFGMAPWITLSVVGATGLVTYLKAKEINKWIETSPLFRKLEPVVKMNTESGGVLYCKALFN